MQVTYVPDGSKRPEEVNTYSTTEKLQYAAVLTTHAMLCFFPRSRHPKGNYWADKHLRLKALNKLAQHLHKHHHIHVHEGGETCALSRTTVKQLDAFLLNISLENR